MGLRTWTPLLTAIIFIMAAAPFADAGQLGRARGSDVDRARPAAPHAYEQGYGDGVRQGETAARNGRPFGGTLFSARSDYGNGFVRGYRVGYERQQAGAAHGVRQDRRVLQQGRAAGRGYREPAFAAGFETGYEKGIEDGREGERYDPVRHRDYRDAERGYREEYGSRDAYRTNFRAGFRQGYEEGYRAGARNRR